MDVHRADPVTIVTRPSGSWRELPEPLRSKWRRTISRRVGVESPSTRSSWSAANQPFDLAVGESTQIAVRGWVSAASTRSGSRSACRVAAASGSGDATARSKASVDHARWTRPPARSTRHCVSATDDHYRTTPVQGDAQRAPNSRAPRTRRAPSGRTPGSRHGRRRLPLVVYATVAFVLDLDLAFLRGGKDGNPPDHLSSSAAERSPGRPTLARVRAFSNRTDQLVRLERPPVCGAAAVTLGRRPGPGSSGARARGGGALSGSSVSGLIAPFRPSCAPRRAEVPWLSNREARQALDSASLADGVPTSVPRSSRSAAVSCGRTRALKPGRDLVIVHRYDALAVLRTVGDVVVARSAAQRHCLDAAGSWRGAGRPSDRRGRAGLLLLVPFRSRPASRLFERQGRRRYLATCRARFTAS